MSSLYVASSGPIVTGAKEANVFILTNSSKDVDILPSELVVSGNKNLTFSILVDMDYDSGGQGIEPLNANRTEEEVSSLTEADIKYGNDIMLSGDMMVYERLRSQAYETHRHQFKGDLVLGLGSSIAVRVLSDDSNQVFVNLRYREMSIRPEKAEMPPLPFLTAMKVVKK